MDMSATINSDPAGASLAVNLRRLARNAHEVLRRHELEREAMDNREVFAILEEIEVERGKMEALRAGEVILWLDRLREQIEDRCLDQDLAWSKPAIAKD